MELQKTVFDDRQAKTVFRNKLRIDGFTDISCL